MTGNQYKKTIDWTLNNIKNDADSIEIATEIFKNNGVAFPKGTCEEILSTLLQDNYMAWEEVTRAEAKNAANNGIATVGVSNNRIVVIKPEEDIEAEADTNSSADEQANILSVSELSLQDAAEMTFFTYTAARKKGESTLDRIKRKFPDGKYWNHVGINGNNADGYTNSPCPTHEHSNVSTCNLFNGAYQCLGFTYRCGYEATGLKPYGEWTSYTNSSALDNLKPGDIVRYYTSSGSPHAIYVTNINGDTVTGGDCNGQLPKRCIISWNKTVSKTHLKNNLIILRSAPYTLDV